MTYLQVLWFLADVLSGRLALDRVGSDRGDVAEKVVIVGIFVAMAITVGLLIKTAVIGDAHHISNTISTAPH